MKKYQTRKATVTARQFIPDNVDSNKETFSVEIGWGGICIMPIMRGRIAGMNDLFIQVNSIIGPQLAGVGDWVVCLGGQDLLVVNDKVFKLIFDPAT